MKISSEKNTTVFLKKHSFLKSFSLKGISKQWLQEALIEWINEDYTARCVDSLPDTATQKIFV